MNYQLKDLKHNTFRNSNKENPLAFLARFLKERGCWNFFRNRFLNSGYYAKDSEYHDLYEVCGLENGINWFIENFEAISPIRLFSSRYSCCFEYDEIPFDSHGKPTDNPVDFFCNELSKDWGNSLSDQMVLNFKQLRLKTNKNTKI